MGAEGKLVENVPMQLPMVVYLAIVHHLMVWGRPLKGLHTFQVHDGQALMGQQIAIVRMLVKAVEVGACPFE